MVRLYGIQFDHGSALRVAIRLEPGRINKSPPRIRMFVIRANHDLVSQINEFASKLGCELDLEYSPRGILRVFLKSRRYAKGLKSGIYYPDHWCHLWLHNCRHLARQKKNRIIHQEKLALQPTSLPPGKNTNKFTLHCAILIFLGFFLSGGRCIPVSVSSAAGLMSFP